VVNPDVIPENPPNKFEENGLDEFEVLVRNDGI
jgi:hypothetical protein